MAEQVYGPIPWADQSISMVHIPQADQTYYDREILRRSIEFCGRMRGKSFDVQGTRARGWQRKPLPSYILVQLLPPPFEMDCIKSLRLNKTFYDNIDTGAHHAKTNAQLCYVPSKETCGYESNSHGRSHSQRTDTIREASSSSTEEQDQIATFMVEHEWPGVDGDVALDWPILDPNLRNGSIVAGIDATQTGHASSLQNPFPRGQMSIEPSTVPWHPVEGLPSTQDIQLENLWEDSTTATYSGPMDVSGPRHTRGFLSIESGGRHRYVGDAFWAFIKGQKPALDDSLSSCINTTKLMEISKALPPRPVADALIFYFMIGVRSVYPLIHMPTFQKQYEAFWQWRQQGSSGVLEDPTFLCILASALYCGATTAIASVWHTKPLDRLQKDDTVKQLRCTLYNSLEVCEHQEKPTLHTLVALLLAHSCTSEVSGPFSCLKFVSMVARIATSMGLHHNGEGFGLSPVMCELRRRVWWHIISLDAQATILSGSRAYFSFTEEDFDVPMFSEAPDECLPGTPASGRSGSRGGNSLSDSGQSAGSGASNVMLLAIGHVEVARFKHLLVRALQSKHGVSRNDYAGFANEVANLHTKLDAILASVPAQGIPERGLLPSRLVNSSPLHDKSLYADHGTEATLLSSWVRIMLTMLKSEASILFQKSFIGHMPANDPDGIDLWEALTNTCITYLRSLLLMIQTPAFSPWMWYFTTHYTPLQCIYVILTYLQDQPTGRTVDLARYYADEVIEVFAPNKEELLFGGPGQCQANEGYSFTGRTSKQLISAWRMILLLYNNVNTKKTSLQQGLRPVMSDVAEDEWLHAR
ncbi:hypothetical protein K431DRAFT_291882 [Polychaeton citri CBS 116435]|uniref:Xylanolytic transcriptional activator regulatory domain-containing protein n=1 Tax=Polychaeton citri CBS 116435 TaxID=1314669 RepID=A0A9P4QDT7_9PEZI|nr:hypothetical protein K431DRAFT_291882 [Polychaeton citri CBS 116435]